MEYSLLAMKFPFQDEIVLENERVLLRPLNEDDVTNLLAIATAQDDLVKFSSYKIHTEEYVREFIANALKVREKKTRYAFSIYDKQAKAYAGSTSYGNIVNWDKRLEIGWTWLGRDFQRTGLNRNMKLLMLDYAFRTLEFERVEFITDERNARSRTAIQAIGGALEGVMRSHLIMPDGFRRNTAIYSILRNEWENELREKLVTSIQ